MSTRRGKQFNSIIQAHYDPLTGATRDQVFLNPEDARSLGVQEGQWVLLRSERGELRGRVKLMPIQPRNVQTFWPEGNVLLERDKTDPLCGIPDYNTQVQIIPLPAGT